MILPDQFINERIELEQYYEQAIMYAEPQIISNPYEQEMVAVQSNNTIRYEDAGNLYLLEGSLLQDRLVTKDLNLLYDDQTQELAYPQISNDLNTPSNSLSSGASDLNTTLTLQTEAQTQSSGGTPTPTPVISMEIVETFTGFVKRDYKVGCTDNVIKKGTPVSGIIYESNVRTCSGVDSDSVINLKKGIDIYNGIDRGSTSFVPLSELTTDTPNKTLLYAGVGVGVLAVGVIAYLLLK